jgi:Na+/alanine symporter
LGAGVGQAMHFGIARRLFSNESGVGSAAIVAAAVQTRNLIPQALVSSLGTFWDAVVACAPTALVPVPSADGTDAARPLPQRGCAAASGRTPRARSRAATP